MRHLKFFVMFAASMAIVAIAISCSSQSSATITQDLSDKMLDNVSFKNGVKVLGQPPAENASATAAPQVASSVYSGPNILVPGSTFTITLTTSYAAPADVKGAMVYVDNIDKVYTQYINVTQSMSGGSLVLEGQVETNDWLQYDNATFGLKIALKLSDTVVGHYVDQALTVQGVGSPSGDTVCEPFTMSGCTNVKACCTTAGSQCWYEVGGKKFMCASSQNCQAAAQALINYCMGY
jgi:hypothetical protein